MGSGAGGHGNQTQAKGLHQPVTWDFLNSVDREAFVPVSGLPVLPTHLDTDDIGKWGYEIDTNTYWRLGDIAPITWVRVNLNAFPHAPSHGAGQADEIDVTGLSGLLADPQTPLPHASTHEAGGTDEIDVTGLSGLLADPQTPVAHASTHLPNGSDALTTAAPSQGIGGGNAVGTSNAFARSNHDHTIRETGGPTDLTVGVIADTQTVGRRGGSLVGYYPLLPFFHGGASMGGGDVGKHYTAHGGPKNNDGRDAVLTHANQLPAPNTGSLRRFTWNSAAGSGATSISIVVGGVVATTFALTGASGTIVFGTPIAVAAGTLVAVRFAAGTPPGEMVVAVWGAVTP